MDFTGKRVLVTGSTMGIGRGAAEMFHEAGATVAINGRSASAVAEVIDRIGQDRLFAAPGDVRSVEGCRVVVETAISGMDGLDCLVNNVGICPLARMMDITEEHWDEVIAVNLRSAVFCTKFALPALRRSGGSIVNVASIGGLMGGPTDSFVYAISKGALVNMTRTLALELASDHVRVNCLCPGYIDTPMIQAENAAADGQVYEFIAKSTPLQRLGSVRECASSILYLASEGAGYITGAVLVNDGGCTANASWGGANYADEPAAADASYTATPQGA